MPLDDHDTKRLTEPHHPATYSAVGPLSKLRLPQQSCAYIQRAEERNHRVAPRRTCFFFPSGPSAAAAGGAAAPVPDPAAASFPSPASTKSASNLTLLHHPTRMNWH